MESPEDILDKHYNTEMDWREANRENVLMAMKEYAKQISKEAFDAGRGGLEKYENWFENKF